MPVRNSKGMLVHLGTPVEVEKALVKLCEYSLSSVKSVAPQDSASQADRALPLEGQLTSLLTHGSQLQFMLSEMISS